MNGLKRRSVRLLGLFEAKTLRQEPGAAEQLYRELIKPYQPLPPLLAMHFQDLARLHLELETSECIRDATLEHRWQQADIEKRRKFYEMESDLPATPKEVFEGGICRIEASAAKFKKQAHYLGLLREQLERRNFDLGNVLQLLYGKDFDPEHDRGQTICSRCRKLMSGEWQLPSEQQEGNIDEEQLEGLLDLVALEEDDALTGYRLKLDEKTVTRAACIAALAPTSDDRLMELQAERLRRAIDRKQWVINGLLQTLRPAEAAKPDANPGPGPEHPLPPHKKSGKRSQEVICNQQNDAKTHEIRTEPKPTEPNSAADKPFETSHRSVAVRSITHRSAPLPSRPRIQPRAALPPSHFRVSPPRLVRPATPPPFFSRKAMPSSIITPDFTETATRGLRLRGLASQPQHFVISTSSGKAEPFRTARRQSRRAWTAGPPPVNQTLAPALYRSEPETGQTRGVATRQTARRLGKQRGDRNHETKLEELANSLDFGRVGAGFRMDDRGRGHKNLRFPKTFFGSPQHRPRRHGQPDRN
ncbi:MAG TPA: hypothetical protein VG860_24255 [Terriglobia bacterium]|nr:hypothetical protein [Terriglobia bacterium]